MMKSHNLIAVHEMNTLNANVNISFQSEMPAAVQSPDVCGTRGVLPLFIRISFLSAHAEPCARSRVAPQLFLLQACTCRILCLHTWNFDFINL